MASGGDADRSVAIEGRATPTMAPSSTAMVMAMAMARKARALCRGGRPSGRGLEMVGPFHREEAVLGAHAEHGDAVDRLGRPEVGQVEIERTRQPRPEVGANMDIGLEPLRGTGLEAQGMLRPGLDPIV